MTTITHSVIAAFLLLLSGCQSGSIREPVRAVETIEVKVPVPVRIEPPAELMAEFVPAALPEFTAPTDAGATSALTREGELRLKELLLDLRNQIRAWQVWAAEK